MFARVFTLLPLALLVSASPLQTRGNSGDSCTTGTQSCCDSTQTLTQATNLLNGVGLFTVAQEAGGLIGLNCMSIGVLSLSGNSCTQQTVCCTNDNFNGLVNVGCTPINIGL